MEFIYTIDSSAEEPIMLIDKHIGMDEEDGEGIMGDKFSRELMFLDTLNKKSIQIWINSGGGVVTDGEQIYNAILNSKTPVDTHNGGTCASIAGPIFLAGRNRFMMDFAKVMMHPVSGGDTKSTKAFENSIQTMLSTRSFLDKEQVAKLMAKTSWIYASECLTLGLSTETKYSADLNVKNKLESTTGKEYSKIVNKLIQNKKIMSKITNRLKLTEHANEEAMVEAIDSIENKYKETIAENKSKFDKMVDELANAKKSKEEAEAKYNEYKAKYDAEETAKEEAGKLANENSAKELVTNGVKLGKIANDAALIEEYTKMAISNPEGTKKIIDALPVSKNAPKPIATNKAIDTNTDELPTTMESFRAKNFAKYKQEAKNRTR